MSPWMRRMQWSGAAALLVIGLGSQAQMTSKPAAPALEPTEAVADETTAASQEIPFASPRAAAVEVPSAPGAWGGERTGSEQTLSDRVVDYVIQATLDPVKHTIEAQQRLTWRNRSDREIRTVYLHTYLNAFEGPGSTYMTEQRVPGFGSRDEIDIADGEWGYIELRSVSQGGKKVAWRYVQPDGGPATDRSVVRFDLPEPVAAGASTTIDISFFDQLPFAVARSGYVGSFHLVAQWFPKMGVLELPGERGATEPRWNVHEYHVNSEFYADFGSYDVSLTVPKGYTVGATGEEVGTPVEKNGMVTHRFVQGDVHDFAWTADNRTAKPLVGEYRGAGSPVVKVTVLYPPENEAAAAPSLKATIDSLKYFSETLGPYPYRTVTVVVPPFNGDGAAGMEYPTFYTADSVSEVEEGTLNQYLIDFVNIHEFGHGYFYGILGSNEFEEPMLDEGLNEYWNSRMIRGRGQTLDLATPMMKRLGLVPKLPVFDMQRMAASVMEPADGVGFNSWDRFSSRSYGTVYSRTATTMRDLEEQIGKQTMERAFKEYYRRWRFRHPSVADLRETLADVSGQRELVERTFAQQVYSVQKVDDRIVLFESEEVLPLAGTDLVDGRRLVRTSDQVDEEVSEARAAWKKKHPQADETKAGPYPYRTIVNVRRAGATVPQTLEVVFADGSRQTVKFDDARRWQRFTWTTPSKAVSVRLDPAQKHNLDANLLDNSRTLKADGRASRRWSLDLAAVLQSFYSLVGTL
ncbi:M1 family metallopeptidase [Arenimonas sp.]|uniref:M1 family metallopeptidase n=1 Tax=Arenimonas sp. TaxID=1872635 RepID=UPI0039E2E7B6